MRRMVRLSQDTFESRMDTAEPHSDPGGYAVVWGASHKTKTAAECCDACAEHAANPKKKKRPCNSWGFCYSYPQCWSLDTGNWHGFGALEHGHTRAHAAAHSHARTRIALIALAPPPHVSGMVPGWLERQVSAG